MREASEGTGLRRRPLWLTALIGTTIPYLAGVAYLVGRIAWYNPGARNLTALTEQSVNILCLCAFLVLPSAFFMLVLLVLGDEIAKPRPLYIWLLSAVAATTPVALVVWVIGLLFGDCAGQCRSEPTFQPSLILYGCGLLGGAIGWFVRYGGRRA